MYYVDCLYKVTEQYRDEYYYNFPWFYDIEKQDTLIEAPVTTEQPNEQRKADDGYAELNAQYERERKRVNEVCKKHAHELAKKDRAIAEQMSEIEKLQKQIAALENKIRKEKQFNRQVEMNAELKQLKKNLEQLTKEEL